MISVYRLKPAFQSLLRPLTRGLARHNVSANQVTIAAALLSLLGGALIAVSTSAQVLILVPVVLLLRMALNAVDGMLAREHDMQTRLGAILNELGDVISDCALYLPLALVAPFNPALIAVMVILAVISEMAGVLGLQVAGGRRYDGPMGKSDRALIVGLLCLGAGLGLQSSLLINGVLIMVLALLPLTIWNRCRSALAAAPGEP